jgi:hypothetical protein
MSWLWRGYKGTQYVWKRERHCRCPIRLTRVRSVSVCIKFRVSHDMCNLIDKSTPIFKFHMLWDTLNLIHSDSVTSNELLWAFLFGGGCNKWGLQASNCYTNYSTTLCWPAGLLGCDTVPFGELFLTFRRDVVPSSPKAKTWILNYTAVGTWNIASFIPVTTKEGCTQSGCSQ